LELLFYMGFILKLKFVIQRNRIQPFVNFCVYCSLSNINRNLIQMTFQYIYIYIYLLNKILDEQ
jgi:hypothetical protein